MSLTPRVAPAGRLAERVAESIAAHLGDAIGLRGVATVALSGGSTPEPMFAALARAELDWAAVQVVQVDERVAPDGDPDRNLVSIHHALVERGPLPPDRLHPMPVVDGEAGAARYGRLLTELTGTDPAAPPVLDVVHLGLGDDGHTASLVPGDPVLSVADRWVALTDDYRGRRRLTLTAPVLSAARTVVWMVAGAAKSGAVAGLLRSDPVLPAVLVRADHQELWCDPAAAGDAGGGPAASAGSQGGAGR